ncbi:hypothetical protein [Rhodococcus sp. P1Y]|uniref:hypothetical protein n=1 Tax=Rhodococcus sp. P1Y TaxID=1302308 RepID=UPI001F29B6C8|nr:hypothetical protein [Rhodococcus sp. P1Y]
MTTTADRPSAPDARTDGQSRRWWNRRAFSRTENTDAALMVGALSIVCFWAPGIGVVLGILAVIAAAWADRSPLLLGEPAPRDDAALAYGSGILGVILGIAFLAMVLPNW